MSLSAYIKAGWHVIEPGRSYVHGWHIDAIGDHLGAVTDNQINRLLINVPPGTMKSLSVGVFWPSWEWGPRNLPHIRTLATSYKEPLAIRDNIKTRRLIQSDWYQSRWGGNFRLMPDQNATKKFENDHTGWRGVAAFTSLTGDRGDRLIIDDPLSVSQAKSDADRLTAQETFLEAVPNRINDQKTSAIVIVMQRLHEDDTSGLALARNLGYEHLMLPMEFEAARRCYTVVRPTHFDAGKPIRARYDGPKQTWYREGVDAPETRQEFIDAAKWQTVYNQDPRTKEGELLFPQRVNREEVERLKSSLGSVANAGQNQQRPAPREGGMFKRSYFRIVDAVPAGTLFVRGWDFAADDEGTGARSAGVKIGLMPDGRFIIAHSLAKWETPSGVRSLLLSTAAIDGVSCKISIPQDPGQAGKDQAQQRVAMLAGYVAESSTETGDKVTRAEPLAAQCEAGNVLLLKGPWNEEFLDEVETFPNGKLKDIVDAASRAFNKLAGPSGGVAMFLRKNRQ